jgi:hypothetical protein
MVIGDEIAGISHVTSGNGASCYAAENGRCVRISYLRTMVCNGRWMSDAIRSEELKPPETSHVTPPVLSFVPVASAP